MGVDPRFPCLARYLYEGPCDEGELGTADEATVLWAPLIFHDEGNGGLTVQQEMPLVLDGLAQPLIGAGVVVAGVKEGREILGGRQSG